MNKECTLCGESKDSSFFYKHKTNKSGLSSWCKSCSVARSKKYMDCPEKKARKKAYDAARVKEKEEIIKRKAKIRYQATRENRIAYVKEWVSKNPEARRMIANNYKHRRRAQERGGVSTARLRAWVDAQTKRCVWCSADCQVAFHVDHVVPLSKGGEHDLTNLAISCPTCNLRKQAKMPLEWALEIEAEKRRNHKPP